MTQRVLVIGATGLLGEPVANALREAGFTVRVMSRDVRRLHARFEEPVELVAGDALNVADVEKALADCEAVHVSIDHDVLLPEIRTLRSTPYWMLRLIARLTRNRRMQNGVEMVSYLEKVGERGDPTEANAILGAPEITLERWLQAQSRRVGSRHLGEAR